MYIIYNHSYAYLSYVQLAGIQWIEPRIKDRSMDLGGLQGMKAINRFNRITDLPCSMDKSYHFHWEVGLCSNRKAIIWPNEIIFHQRFSWNNGISLPKRYILGAEVVWGRYNLTRVMHYSIWMYCIWVVAAIIFSHTQTLTNSHDWWVPCPSNMKSGRCSDRWMLQACYVTERRMKSSNKKTSLDRVPCQSIDSKTQKSWFMVSYFSNWTNNLFNM